MSCMTSGTGVKPSGMLICAAAAVSAVMNSTAATRMPADVEAPVLQVVSSVSKVPTRPCPLVISDGF